MCNPKKVEKSLQVLLWLWFGTITSFCAVNVVNIAKLETRVDLLEKHNKTLNDRITLLKHQNLKK
jgi:cell division protein FtsB